ncbi:YggS family pyridoxal phosphate-dependent enzyme [Diplocloster modestus]|uniref:Pyridoxal phosphate homeostasis protein n=1 Tax=Diplocloster modestus TaxID=2850322 RepID=A0ABS6KCI4_9FIRM|nr:YggS family pyridoxal phosphate-dependent enzyme [Diplocloster modestus]MBU9728223.1 YggS family pyridoxal phosphate-dependent enzyme [Diplocloster modestus]
MVKENLAEVETRIGQACERAGRNREEVTLIAVSKTKPVSMVEEAIGAGIVDFGENKVQEIVDKYEVLPRNLNWHMIGHLQRNKVKYIVDKVCMIHSVDSLKLAETISELAVKKNVEVPVLIEVNMAGEDSKFGVTPEAAPALVEAAAKLPGIRVSGLMTIAPFVENPEDNRIHFRNLRKLSVDITGKNIDNVSMSALSMGMTGDYEVAIEEGATMVRVGTGIFGARNYTIPGNR